MLIELSNIWIIILDILAWFFFHMIISILIMRVPDSYFIQNEEKFAPFSWEKEGEIWQSLFRIRSWKKYLPDSSIIFSNSYDLTNLQELNQKNLEKMIIETKRAELTHWLSILPAPVFLIWNPPWAGVIMIIYALVANLPFIITQRYNRPRLQRIYQMRARRESSSL